MRSAGEWMHHQCWASNAARQPAGRAEEEIIASHKSKIKAHTTLQAHNAAQVHDELSAVARLQY